MAFVKAKVWQRIRPAARCLDQKLFSGCFVYVSGAPPPEGGGGGPGTYTARTTFWDGPKGLPEGVALACRAPRRGAPRPGFATQSFALTGLKALAQSKIVRARPTGEQGFALQSFAQLGRSGPTKQSCNNFVLARTGLPKGVTLALVLPQLPDRSRCSPSCSCSRSEQVASK